MTTSLRVWIWTFVAVFAAAANSFAQTTTKRSDPESRPAFTTATGDTGLWYVPTAEVLAHGKWSASGYRESNNYRAGFSNVAEFPLTVGYGVLGRAEAFAAFSAVTRIDRDLRPIFIAD